MGAGGCVSVVAGEERGAEFLLAETAPRAGCWLAEGEAAGGTGTDAVGGEGAPPAGAAD